LIGILHKVIIYQTSNNLIPATKALFKGTIPLKHPKLHAHRDFNKSISSRKVFKVSHYEPEKIRIRKSVKYNKSIYDNKEAYSEDDPIKKKDWYRSDNPGKWIGIGSFRYKNRTENERIVQKIKKNAEVIDLSVNFLAVHITGLNPFSSVVITSCFMIQSGNIQGKNYGKPRMGSIGEPISTREVNRRRLFGVKQRRLLTAVIPTETKQRKPFNSGLARSS